jgi:formylglycine-generating enzyme required for sulfatase activity
MGVLQPRQHVISVLARRGVVVVGSGEKGSYLERTAAVGSYAANPLGLFDVIGNAREWCADEYRPYGGGKAAAAGERVVRGGGWSDVGRDCRADALAPGERRSYVVFRVVCTMHE